MQVIKLYCFIEKILEKGHVFVSFFTMRNYAIIVVIFQIKNRSFNSAKHGPAE